MLFASLAAPAGPVDRRLTLLTRSPAISTVRGMTSAIRRLLEEISWEGNAAKFHDGGLGKENVLTVVLKSQTR